MLRILAVVLPCHIVVASVGGPDVYSTTQSMGSVITASPQSASSVCVYNDAAFSLHWHLLDEETGVTSEETYSYPVWQVRCLNPAKMNQLRPGATLVPVIQAVWGLTEKPSATLRYEAPQMLVYDGVQVSQATYVCTGTTLQFSCKLGEPPITIGNATKDMGKFLIGFGKGLGRNLDFKNCIDQLGSLYKVTVEIVRFFETGFNRKNTENIVHAFELVGELMKNLASTISDCVKDGLDLVSKLKSLAASLSGNVLAIIKMVVKEAVHIFHDRKELTGDCKGVVADWRAGDFEGSGFALGDIIGALLGGVIESAHLPTHQIIV